jgi:hypothetical protein
MFYLPDLFAIGGSKINNPRLRGLFSTGINSQRNVQ